MKRLKQILSFTLMLAMVIGLLPVTALAAEQESFPLYNEDQLVADDDTLFVTLIEQEPGSDQITATTYIENNNAEGESILLDIIGTELSFTSQVAPYNTETGLTYTGGALTDRGSLDGYYDTHHYFNEMSPEMISNNATDGRYVSAVMGISNRDLAMEIPAGESQDVMSYYFQLTDGSELDLDTFSYVYEYYNVWDALTFFGLGNRLVLTNYVKNSGQQEFVISDQTFKIHVKRQAPEGLSANDTSRTITGYNSATMEWATSADAPDEDWTAAHPTVGTGEETYYVRMQGDADYRQDNDPEYGNYKKYVASDAVEVNFDYASGLSAQKTNSRDETEPTKVGDIVTYTVTVTNSGTVPVTGVVVHDQLADGVEYVSGSAALTIDGASATAPAVSQTAERVLEIEVGTIPAGGVAVVTFDLEVTEDAEGESIQNVGTVTSNEDEDVPFDDDDEREVEPADAPDIQAEKSNNRDEVNRPTRVGDVITYTIDVVNNGTAMATDVEVTDYLADGVELVSGSVYVDGVQTNNYSTANGGRTLIVPVGDLDIGDTAQVTFQVEVLASAAGNSIQNLGEVKDKDGNGPDIDDEDDDPVALLNVTKTSDRSDPTRVGDIVEYTIAVENASNETTVYDAVVTDRLVEYVQLVDGSVKIDGRAALASEYELTAGGELKVYIDEIAPESTVVVTFEVEVLETALDQSIQNLGDVTGYTDEDHDDDDDPDVEDDFDDGNDDKVGPEADAPRIQAEKSNNRDEVNRPTRVGDVITYTIDVVNSGTAMATGVEVTDYLANGVTLVPGSVYVDGVQTNDYSTANGGRTLIVPVGDLDIGDTAQVTFQVEVLASAAGNSIQNLGEVKDKDGNGPDIDDEDDDPVALLNVSKTSDRSDPTRVGDIVEYTIAVENASNETTVYDAVVTDRLVEYVQLVDGSVKIDGREALTDEYELTTGGELKVYIDEIAPLATVVVTFEVEVLETALDQSIQNLGDVTGYTDKDHDDDDDPDVEDDFDDGNDDKVEPEADRPIIEAEKTSDRDPDVQTRVGDIVTYTITVENRGNVTAPGYTYVYDYLPDGVSLRADTVEVNGALSSYYMDRENNVLEITLGDIGPGDTVIITFEVEVLPAAAGKSIENTGLVGEEKITDGNDDPVAMLKVTKTNDRSGTTQVGDIVSYEIVVENESDVDPVYDAVVNDRLVAYVQLVDGSVKIDGQEADEEAYTVEDGVLKISLGDIDPGESVTVTFDVEVLSSAAGRSIQNVGDVTGYLEADHDDDDEPDVEEPFDDGDSNLVERPTTPPAPTTYYTVTFYYNNDYADEDIYDTAQVESGTAVSKPEDPEIIELDVDEDGVIVSYEFAGWYTEDQLALETGEEYNFSLAVTGDLALYADWDREERLANVDPPEIDLENHFAYMVGYEEADGTFKIKPDDNITRGETATLFFRIITDESRETYWSKTNNFADVASADWYNNAISTAYRAGLVTGHSPTEFAPEDDITRAEFAALAARFTGVDSYTGSSVFSDVPEDEWYWEEVHIAYQAGWIQGDAGSDQFRPDDPITRAEVATLVNRMRGSIPENMDDLLDDMIVWVDNPAPGESGHDWYYYDIQEATNSHYSELKLDEDGNETGYETWTELRENRNWTVLQREDATPQMLYEGETWNERSPDYIPPQDPDDDEDGEGEDETGDGGDDDDEPDDDGEPEYPDGDSDDE